MRVLWLLLALLVLGVVPHDGVEAASTSKLQIHIPNSLKKPGDGYDHREAMFGIPPYGGSIQQQLIYAGGQLCSSEIDQSQWFPAREPGSDGPFILMIDRGDCTFVTKVRNAQHAGAAGVLIADNACQCSHEECIPDDGVECELMEPIMADDGSGADITIPAFLLFKEDSDTIKDTIMDNTHVRVEMIFSVPAPDSRVEYDIWMSPKSAVSKPFLDSFKEAAVALDKDAFFTPHMFIYDGMKAGCDFFGEDECFTLCTNNGRYCSTDPDDDLEEGISGADVVTEGLRRLCIWKTYGAPDGIGVKWWDYTEEFYFRCDNDARPDLFTNEECISDAMSHADVDKKLIDDCMEDAGGLEGDIENTLLQKELQNAQAAGIVVIPTILVNQSPVLGSLSFDTVFKAICAGYAPGYEPSVCSQCSSCPNEKHCVVNGFCSGGAPMDSVPVSTFAASMLALTVFFGCVGIITYRRQQSHMRAQVRGILAEYMPLDANQKVGSVGIPDVSEATTSEFSIE